MINKTPLVLALGLVACGASTPPPKPVPTEAPEKLDTRYDHLPVPTAAPVWAPPSVQQETLKNGLGLWHLQKTGAPLVSIQLVLTTGSSSDPKGKAGLTLLASDMLDEGAGNLSALELSDELGNLATDYDAKAGLDYVLLSMNVLAENLDENLKLLSWMVQKPTLAKVEFERRRAHHISSALAEKADPRSRMKAALSRVLFGEGYAGAPSQGTEESLKAITLADVKAQVKKLTVAEGAHLVIAGDIDQAQARALAEKHFGSWQGKRAKGDSALGAPADAGRAYVVNFPGAAQSSLAIARLAGDAHDPNYFAEMVMNQKLGESFTSRINLNLREDKGYTYGAVSQFNRFDHAGYFAIMANVHTETTAASVTEVFKELSELCGSRPLSAVEHRESIDGLLLGYPSQFSHLDGLGLRAASLPIYERPADFWTTWPTEVGKITLNQANEVAAPYCDTKSYRIVIAGDLLKIEPEFEKLGIEVVEVDRDGVVLKKEAAAPGKSPAAAKGVATKAP